MAFPTRTIMAPFAILVVIALATAGCTASDDRPGSRPSPSVPVSPGSPSPSVSLPTEPPLPSASAYPSVETLDREMARRGLRRVPCP